MRAPTKAPNELVSSVAFEFETPGSTGGPPVHRGGSPRREVEEGGNAPANLLWNRSPKVREGQQPSPTPKAFGVLPGGRIAALKRAAGSEIFFPALRHSARRASFRGRCRKRCEKKVKKALLLFHRGHEHSGRWQETVDSLGLEEVAIFAWDARGHGRSPGKRGAAQELSDVIKDVEAFVRLIAECYEIALEHMILFAHSLAAVTVSAWVTITPRRFAGLFWRRQPSR